MSATPATGIKDEARRVIDSLPDHATWEDVIYAMYVRERVERGLDQAARDEVIEEELVFAELDANE